MKRLIVAAIVVFVSATSVLAQTPGPTTTALNYHRAPAPLIAAGPVGLVIVAGYGVYWLVKRRRRNTAG